MKTFLAVVFGTIFLLNRSFSQQNNSIGTQPTSNPQHVESTDLSGGTLGQIPFQSAASRTSFSATTLTAVGTLTAADQIVPFVRTKAQIDALVPRAVGAMVVCSDCTITYSVCTATGTLAAQWARAGSSTVGCGTNN